MALSFLKIPLTIQISIWKLLSAILHLGNIQFSKLDRGEGSHIVNLEGIFKFIYHKVLNNQTKKN